jgi:hypothetical protein
MRQRLALKYQNKHLTPHQSQLTGRLTPFSPKTPQNPLIF